MLTMDSSGECKTLKECKDFCCKVKYFDIRRISSSTDYKLSINQVRMKIECAVRVERGYFKQRMELEAAVA